MNNRVLPFITLSASILPLQAAPSNKTETERPNILFIIADDASYQHFGAYGCSWIQTPAFDKVAQDGILFTRCYTSNAKSAPSRSCILTGKYFFQMEAATNHLPYFPNELEVFTEILEKNGYRTGYTGKGWGPGIVEKKEGKERTLTGKPYNQRTTQPPTKDISRVDYAENFSDFLNETPNGQPWFFWFGCFEPHRNYEYGSGARLSQKSTDTIPGIPSFWPDNDIVRNDLLDYGFEIEYFDIQIGKFLTTLKERGILDNTLVIVTSDNGMPFPRCKGNNYEYSNHMPLAIMWKDKIKPGKKVRDIVNFMDFAPTILEVANINNKPFPGHSLTEYFTDEKRTRPEYRKHTLIGRERHDYGRPGNQGYPIRGIVTDRFLYICNLKPHLLPAGNPETGYTDCDGSPTKTQILNLKRANIDRQYYNLSFGLRPEDELYDLSLDAECMINLSKNPEYQAIKKELQEMLWHELQENNDPRMTGDGDIFDRYPCSESVGINFWEKVTRGEITAPWKITGWISPTDYNNYNE